MYQTQILQAFASGLQSPSICEPEAGSQRQKHGGFLKWRYPQSSSIFIGFSTINHLFWGLNHCRKPPNTRTQLRKYGATACWKCLISCIIHPNLDSASVFGSPYDSLGHEEAEQELASKAHIPYCDVFMKKLANSRAHLTRIGLKVFKGPDFKDSLQKANIQNKRAWNMMLPFDFGPCLNFQLQFLLVQSWCQTSQNCGLPSLLYPGCRCKGQNTVSVQVLSVPWGHTSHNWNLYLYLYLYINLYIIYT